MRRKCSHCSKRIGAEKRSDSLYCNKNCSSAAKFQRSYKETPQKFLDKARAFSAAKPASRLWTNAKSRAKKSGLPFDISISDITVPTVCPVLGVVLKGRTGRNGAGYNSPTLDRIVPALGYVRGNVRVISYRANLLKSDATVEELEAVLCDLKGLHCNT